MNPHPQREKLSDFLCDSLGPTERAGVESHLAQCAQCARELHALQQMQRTVASLAATTPPKRVRANVRAELRANKKQSGTLPVFLAHRTAPSRNARNALPFALPARQLAWGGAVALGAVGLMLLARPSLQNSPLSQSAPVSETKLAADARATADAVAGTANGATANSAAENGVIANGVAANGASKKPNAKALPAKAKGNVAPGQPNSKTAPANAGTFGSPDSVASLPPLPPPPPPRIRLAQPESLAPFPEMKTPSFEPSPDIAPIPVPQKNVGKPPARPNAPAAIAKPVSPAKPAPAAQRSLGRDATRQQAPSMSRSNVQSEATSSMEKSSSRAQSSGASRSAGADAQSRDSESDSAGFAPPMVARAAPVAPQKSASAGDWAGGEVEAALSVPQISAGRAKSAAKNQAPVLTMSVGIAIGYARLFLLLPQGKTQVWRGSMNAAPIEIKLPVLAGKARSGQKIRARLEQMDDEGNPKASTNFTVVWP